MDPQSDPIEVSDETESAIREYHTNGASVIRGILDQKWISTMREASRMVEIHFWSSIPRMTEAPFVWYSLIADSVSSLTSIGSDCGSICSSHLLQTKKLYYQDL